MPWEWTEKRVRTYIDHLQSGEYEYPSNALDALAKRYKVKHLDPGSARRAVRRMTGKNPMDLIVQPEPELIDVNVEGPNEETLQRIVDMTRRGPITLEMICEECRVLPSRARELVQQAIKDGYTMRISDDGTRLEDAGLRPRGRVKTVQLAPTHGRLRIAVISDLHFGSKYHRGSELANFMQRAYDWGARITLNCGDTLDGNKVYKGQEFETSQVAMSDQINSALDGLPQLPDHKYYFIDGNHDASFWRQTGQLAGEAILNAAMVRGRSDLEYLGPDMAQLDLAADEGGKPARIELLHPARAGARGQTYHLQNYIESIQGGNKPHIMLVGHEHSYVVLELRNIHALKVPCFQAQTPFMARRHMQPTIGGLLLEIGLTKRGMVRELTITHIKYFGAEY